jgi:hypothetical protein
MTKDSFFPGIESNICHFFSQRESPYDVFFIYFVYNSLFNFNLILKEKSIEEIPAMRENSVFFYGVIISLPLGVIHRIYLNSSTFRIDSLLDYPINCWLLKCG